MNKAKEAKFHLLQKAENQTDFQERSSQYGMWRSGCRFLFLARRPTPGFMIGFCSYEQVSVWHTSTSAVDCSSRRLSRQTFSSLRHELHGTSRRRVVPTVSAVPSHLLSMTFQLTMGTEGASAGQSGRIRLISDGAPGNERARVLQGETRFIDLFSFVRLL